MSAGQIWRRADGLLWAEVQAEAMEPSGWRLMVPLVPLEDAPHAPPLAIEAGEFRARVHLLTSAPADQLGEPADQLTSTELSALRAAVRRLVGAESQPGSS